MSKIVVVIRELFQSDPAVSGSESEFVSQIKQIPGVIEVKKSELFSLQSELLPTNADGATVIIVGMALRYADARQFLKSHHMQLVELHADDGSHRNDLGGFYDVPVRHYNDLQDALRIIAEI